ncbi:hypothetical protein EXA18_17630 [Vibrio cincinnatiensis]|nr:hypothetical protein [Vibrio cincinnatiensis]MCG3738138.1 hypothetical protein [Vibrio cincinnatiensis]MCG3745235.1 hypothetical protein [Vibrio cincinnatiensis]
MNRYILISLVILLTACQSTSQSQSRHFLDGVAPEVGKYGYKAEKTPDYWVVTNSAYSKNEVFGLLNLNWASLGKSNRFMWLTTMPGGDSYCDYKDVHSGHAALKVNGEWVKSEFTCMTGGVLSFSLEDKFILRSMKIDVAVVFDYLGEAAGVYEFMVYFDNENVMSAMKFAYDKSVENAGL